MITSKSVFVRELIAKHGVIYRAHFHAKDVPQRWEVFSYLDALPSTFYVTKEGSQPLTDFDAFKYRKIVYAVSKADLLVLKLGMSQYLHYVLESVSLEDGMSWTWQHLREKLNE